MRGVLWRVSAAVVAVLVLAACFRSPAKPEPESWPGPVTTAACGVHKLGFPPGTDASSAVDVEGTDSSGRYVVGDVRVLSDGVYLRYVPVLWDNEVPRVLLDVGDASAVAVNSRGWAVGWANPMAGAGSSAAYGWVYPGEGPVTPLPLPDGYTQAQPVDINERGEILGWAMAPLATLRDAVVWEPTPDGGFTARILATFLPEVNVSGIGDDGTVIGTVGPVASIADPAGAELLYAWLADGSGHEIVRPDVVSPNSGILDVDGDWVLMNAQPSGLARWNIRTGDVSTMDDVNTATLLSPPVVSSRGVAFSGRPAILLADAMAYALPAPEGTPSTWVVEVGAASAVNVAGVVRTHNAGTPSQSIGVVWRCSLETPLA